MYKRVIVAALLLIAFSLSTASVGFAMNNPTWLKEKDPIEHPWGGDDNGPADGGRIDSGPVAQYTPDTFVYGGGTKAGLVVGLFDFVWVQVRGYILHVNANPTVVNTGGRTAVGSTAVDGSTTGPSGGKVGQ